MVRVCLYLALALGLAGSGNAAPCATNLAVANAVAAATTTTASGNYLGACTVTTGSVVPPNTHDPSETCGIQCSPGYHMTGNFLVTATEALVVCNDALVLQTDFKCTACTAQTSCTTSTANSCSSNTDIPTKKICTVAANGFYVSSQKVTACDSQTGCATEDKTAACVGTSKYKCTKPMDGYYLTGAATYLVSATECDGPQTGQGNYAAARTADKFTKNAEWGAKCAKADGTLDTGKGTIANCPPGSFLDKVDGSNDKCTACATGTNAVCHCTEKGGATKCLATGTCDSLFWKYTGTAGSAGSCVAVTACKLGEFEYPSSTSATDNTCTDCPTITNVLKANTECDNLVRSTVIAAATDAWTKTNFRATLSTRTAADQCKSDTYTCGDNSYLSTADPPVCTDCADVGNAASYGKRVCDTAGALTSATTYAFNKMATSVTDFTATGCANPGGGACAAGTNFIPASAKGSGCPYTCTAVTTKTGENFIRTDGKTTADQLFGSYQAVDQPYACKVGEGCKLVVTGTNIKSTAANTNTDQFWIGEPNTNPDCADVLTDSLWPVANAFPTLADNGVVAANKVWSVNTDGTELTINAEEGVLTGTAGQKHALCMYQRTSDPVAAAQLGAATTPDGDLAGTYKRVGIITMAASTNKKCAQFNVGVSTPSCKLATVTQDIETNGGAPAYAGGAQFKVKNGYKAACSIACSTANGIFKVTEADACTAMTGCLGTVDGVINGGTYDSTVACVGSGKDKYKCTSADHGYFLVENGLGDTVSSCMSAGQKAIQCSDACWYKGTCKDGYSLTKGEAKKSDICVSDSAASLSLTAVLLSVVAKVFLF